MTFIFVVMILLHVLRGQYKGDKVTTDERSPFYIFLRAVSMLSPIMTLCAYRLTDAFAFTAFPGKRRNATRRHMAKERARCVISDHVVTCDREARNNPGR